MPAGGSATGSKIGLHTFAGVYNVQQFGAIGDGVANDTAAIQAALDQCATDGGGCIYLPKGVYLVRPSASGGTILTMNTTGLRVRGAGIGQSTIRVGASVLPYKGVLGPLTTPTDLSRLTVDHLTVDHNIANNAIVSGASIAANPQFSVFAYAGTDITYTHLEVINASSINNLVINGTTCVRASITDCRFSVIGDDPNHVSHDASIIYTDATEVVIRGNLLVSTGQDQPGATTGIETHGSRTVVSGNTIRDFRTGMNITGVGAADTVGVTVTGNVIEGANIGIFLWSVQSGSHTTGYGLHGVTVTANVIHLAGTAAWATKNTAHTEYGIALYPTSSTLDATGISLTDNVITHPLEAVAITNNAASYGIGWLPSDTPTLSNSRIANNVIVNFPMAGIRFSCPLTNVDICDNTLINCGSTLDTAFAGNSAFRQPLFLGGVTYSGVRISRNSFRDSLAEVTYRPAYFIDLYQSNASAGTGVELVDNSFLSTGSAMTGQLFMDNAGGGLVPYLRGAIPNYVALTGTLQKFALGSQVVDPATGVLSTIQANQYTWQTGLLTTPLLARLRRLSNVGSSLVVGDITIVGWGAGAAVTSVAGSDMTARILVTAGTGPSALPTIAFTWKDGAWASAPTVLAQMTGGSGTLQLLYVSANTATVTITYNGTPVDTKTYLIELLTVGVG